MKTLAAYNIKGGVGKTSTTVNLAYLSALGGARTLVWDLDPQGAATFYFRIKAKVKGGGRRLFRRKRELDPLIRGTDFELLDLLPADFSYRNLDLLLDRGKKPAKRLSRLLAPLAGSYDHVFLDCPPSISLVSESVFVASDVLLVPTMPTTLSLRTLEQLQKHLARMDRGQPRILPFFCMVDRRRSLHRTVSGLVGGNHGFLRTQIPNSSTVEQMGTHRSPVGVFAARSAPARAYEELWNEILDVLEPGLPPRTNS